MGHFDAVEEGLEVGDAAAFRRFLMARQGARRRRNFEKDDGEGGGEDEEELEEGDADDDGGEGHGLFVHDWGRQRGG